MFAAGGLVSWDCILGPSAGPPPGCQGGVCELRSIVLGPHSLCIYLMHAFSTLLSEAACHRVWRDGPSCTSRSGAGRRAGALRFVRSFAFDQVQSEGSKPQCDLGSERYLAIWPGGARNRRLCLNRPVVAACYAMLQLRIFTARKKFMQATFTAWMIAYPHN